MLFYCYLSQIYDAKLERIEAFYCVSMWWPWENLTELKSKSFVEEPKEMAWGIYTKFDDIDGNEFSWKNEVVIKLLIERNTLSA